MPCPLQKHHLVLKNKGIVYKKYPKGSLFLFYIGRLTESQQLTKVFRMPVHIV